MFPSRQEAWKAARAFVERFAREAGLERAKGLRTNRVVEELSMNAVRDGHRGGSDAHHGSHGNPDPQGRAGAPCIDQL